MPIIWGFNLSEMRWSAFGHKQMFDRRWPLRRERFVLYQVAMLIGLVAECIATYSLSKYEFHQSRIEELSNYTAAVHNNDLIAAAVLTIVFCVFVATLFGADFFFLVFWPRRTYPRWYETTKKALAVFITLGMAAAALMSTVVVARHSSTITGVSPAEVQRLVSVYSRPPVLYRRFGQNIAWVVLLWIAFIGTIAATTIMFIASAHVAKHGTAPRNIIDLNGDVVEKNGHGHGGDIGRGGDSITTDEMPIRDSGLGKEERGHVGNGASYA